MKNAIIENHGEALVRWGWVLQAVLKAGLVIYFAIGLVAILAL